MRSTNLAVRRPAPTIDIMLHPETEANGLLDTVWRELSPDRRVPVDPIRISRALGVDVFDADMEKSLSGMLVKRSGRDPYIVLNRADSPKRAVFTCAHELGHYLLRAGNDDDFESVDYRGPLATTGQSPDEVFANRFAAALLMPAEAVRGRFAEQPSVATLAWEFQVSPDAMTFRLKHLGLL